MTGATIGESTSPAIRVRNLTKSYKLYPNRHARIREAFDWRGRIFHKELHALDDVSFDVPRGATLGILGVNGSGKSTLLQILCRIIPPSAGEMRVDGRIAALIELGAGFNPDSTGRENVVVNGMILGLSQAQVTARTPQIEAFAEIGEFFDQPVKTYSTGMLMRVAFALAISVDPEVLIIDEALAVGDARFQQKCFRRFREIQDSGRTILFVTHDRFSLPRLCTHGAVLHQGRLVHFGDPSAATDVYSEILINGRLGSAPAGRTPAVGNDGVATEEKQEPEKAAHSGASGPAEAVAGAALKHAAVAAAIAAFTSNRSGEDRCASNPTYNKNEYRIGDGGAAIVDYLIAIDGRINPTHVNAGSLLSILLRVRFDEVVSEPIIGFAVKAKDGVVVFSTNTSWLRQPVSTCEAGDLRIYRFDFPLHLGANEWFIDVAVARSRIELFDARNAMIMIRCDPHQVGHGLASLKTDFAEAT